MTEAEKLERIRRLRLLQRNLAAHPLTRENARVAANSLQREILRAQAQRDLAMPGLIERGDGMAATILSLFVVGAMVAAAISLAVL